MLLQVKLKILRTTTSVNHKINKFSIKTIVVGVIICHIFFSLQAEAVQSGGFCFYMHKTALQ